MNYKDLIQNAIKILDNYIKTPAAFYENTELKEFKRIAAKDIKFYLSHKRDEKKAIPEVVGRLEEQLKIIQYARNKINSDHFFKAGEDTLEASIKELIHALNAEERFLKIKDEFIKRLDEKLGEFSCAKAGKRDEFLIDQFYQVKGIVENTVGDDFDGDDFRNDILIALSDPYGYMIPVYEENIEPFLCYILKGEEESLGELRKAHPQEATDIQGQICNR
jgi:hypothetical protein